jgi:hypothetical protein
VGLGPACVRTTDGRIDLEADGVRLSGRAPLIMAGLSGWNGITAADRDLYGPGMPGAKVIAPPASKALSAGPTVSGTTSGEGGRQAFRRPALPGQIV